MFTKHGLQLMHAPCALRFISGLTCHVHCRIVYFEYFFVVVHVHRIFLLQLSVFRMETDVTTAMNARRAMTCVTNATVKEKGRSTKPNMECLMTSPWRDTPTWP